MNHFEYKRSEQAPSQKKYPKTENPRGHTPHQAPSPCARALNSSLFVEQQQTSWSPTSSSLHSLLLLQAPTLLMDDSETKRKRMSEPTVGDFLLGGKDIQNKAGRPIGAAGTEDRHFR